MRAELARRRSSITTTTETPRSRSSLPEAEFETPRRRRVSSLAGLAFISPRALEEEEMEIQMMPEEPSIPVSEFELQEETARTQEVVIKPDRMDTVTRRLLEFLHEAMADQPQVELESLLEGMQRLTAARAFYQVLVLSTLGKIELRQDEPYGPIQIIKTATFGDFSVL
eukprot:TRINITY_DN16121_c0_g1::TRINITY_DN16121_c0_g1_i1::g.13694::m.13694 TRINITY_DN16121_c0_g1::TRINITY_DN16121_c0_g1_i1::g.13694  ORF type:complete len:169 (-),score=32.63,sp/Q9S7T7/SCC11_ARATH/32.90/6e-08,Rad21_Rec8/PF04824.11/1.2e-14,ScpA_ScpB/PF02616.9/9e-08 TRINITY_DN16121_c0_g1_i1:351-857(-)